VNCSYTYNMDVNILVATTCGVCTYHSLDPIFQSLWSLLLFLWWEFSANKEITRSLWTFYGHHHDMDNRYGVYILWITNGYVPFVVITIRSCRPHSWLTTGCVTRPRGRVPHVHQDILTLPSHLSSTSVFRGVRVSRSLDFCVMFY
jgi:hypothetical protein